METAVEWFLENLKNLIKESELTDMRPSEFDARERELFEQAKEMEKNRAEQHSEFCIRCDSAGIPIVNLYDWKKK